MTSDNYTLKDDVKLVCCEAKSFPDGVQEAFRTLKRTLPDSPNHALFGISYPGKEGKIVYKAAAQAALGAEEAKRGLATFILPSGEYVSVYITDFISDESRIGRAFRELLADPRIDPNGCCVEMYVKGRDVRCMVRLDPVKVRQKMEDG